ncbi:hypothetical protein, partial [Acinetobacter baumannii]|uniref:hypothetical protein n=1 Tax=Acinetobacter baumannii TaxID=470 RepID=UPI001BC89629
IKQADKPRKIETEKTAILLILTLKLSILRIISDITVVINIIEIQDIPISIDVSFNKEVSGTGREIRQLLTRSNGCCNFMI